MECLPIWVSLIFSHDKIMVNNFDKNSTEMIHYIGNYRFFFFGFLMVILISIIFYYIFEM